jgi:hypothetical protein
MSVLCKLTGHTLPHRCGDCRGYCIEQVGMTTPTLDAYLSPPGPEISATLVEISSCAVNVSPSPHQRQS